MMSELDDALKRIEKFLPQYGEFENGSQRDKDIQTIYKCREVLPLLEELVRLRGDATKGEWEFQDDIPGIKTDFGTSVVWAYESSFSLENTAHFITGAANITTKIQEIIK